MKMFIIDNNYNIVAVLNSDSQNTDYHFFNAKMTDTLNKGSEIEFDMEVTDVDDLTILEQIKEEQQICFKFNDEYRLYYIKEVDETHAKSNIRHIYGIDASIELIDFTCLDELTGDNIILTALTKLLSGTGWTVKNTSTLESFKFNGGYKNKNVLSCLQQLADQTNKELIYSYEIANNKIVAKYVELVDRVGHDYGKRFIYDKDITSIKRSINTNSLKTAIYPIGKEDKKAGTVVTLKDVQYTQEHDGIDKPIGISYLENKKSTELWGYLVNGTRVPRSVVMNFNDADTVEKLFTATMEQLNKLSVPIVTYSCSVIDLYHALGEKDLSYTEVKLGDTVRVLDSKFKPALTLSSRLVKIEYNLNDLTKTQMTLGTLVPTIVDAKDPQKQMEKIAQDTINNSSSNIDLTPIQKEIDALTDNIGRYPAIAEINQQLFNGAVGFHSLTKDNGLWVYDKPIDQHPTKAVVIKGGQIGIATYNTQLQKWDLGTFINGMSVNASLINAGKLSVDVIDAGSITADKLAIEVQNKINKSVDNTFVENSITTAIKQVQGEIKQSIEEVNKTTTAISDDLAGTKNTLKDINENITNIQQTQESITNTVKKNTEHMENLTLGTYNLLNGGGIPVSGNEYGFNPLEFNAVQGQEYTLAFKGYCDQQVLADNKSLSMFIYKDGWDGYKIRYVVDSTTPDIYYYQFTATETAKYIVEPFCFPEDGTTTGKVYVDWVVILAGNMKPADFIPSKQDLAGDFSNTFASKSEVKQTADQLKISFEQSGGSNIIHNSYPTAANNKYWGYNLGADSQKFDVTYSSEHGGENWQGTLFKGGIWFNNKLPATGDNWAGIYNSSLNKENYNYNFNLLSKYTLTFPIYSDHDGGSVQIVISDYKTSDNVVFLSEVQTLNTGYQMINLTFTPNCCGNDVYIWLFNATKDGSEQNYFIPWMLLQRGIKHNAPWCPAADEVYGGITSIDRDGIKITHELSDSYTNVNSEGLEIFDSATGKSIAHFGKNQTAYIRQLDAQQINSDNLLPIVFPPYTTINCRAGGSGDKSGKDADNCADGINNALYIATQGHYSTGCIINGDVTIKMHGYNTPYNEEVYCSNILGFGDLNFDFASDTVLNGNMTFVGCTKSISINGYNGAVLSEKKDTIVAKGCRSIAIYDLNIVTKKNDWEKSIVLNKTNTCYLSNVDMSNGYIGIQLYGSICHVNGCIGSNMDYSIVLDSGSALYSQKSIPNSANGQLSRGASQIFTIGDVPAVDSKYSIPPVKDVIVERTFNGGNYRSSRSYTENGTFIQGSWSSPYGNWRGFVDFDGISDFLSDASVIHSVQIYLSRKDNSHGYSNGASIMLNGTDNIGTLARGQDGWFTLPQWFVNDLKNGKQTANFFSTAPANYIIFNTNAKLWVKATKQVRG